jgi:hypothetical protein
VSVERYGIEHNPLWTQRFFGLGDMGKEVEEVEAKDEELADSFQFMNPFA